MPKCLRLRCAPSDLRAAAKPEVPAGGREKAERQRPLRGARPSV